MVSTRSLVVTAGAAAILAAGLGGFAALRVNDADRRRADPAQVQLQPPPAEIGQPIPAESATRNRRRTARRGRAHIRSSSAGRTA